VGVEKLCARAQRTNEVNQRSKYVMVIVLLLCADLMYRCEVTLIRKKDRLLNVRSFYTADRWW
jgi:hypothetical protein